MMTQDNSSSPTIEQQIIDQLHQADLFGVLQDTASSKFMRYVMQPQTLMKNGWLIDPALDISQRSRRSYIIGQIPDLADGAMGQRLIIDRDERKVVLITYTPEITDTKIVDLATFEILDSNQKFHI